MVTLQSIENHFIEKNVLTLQNLSQYFHVSVRTVQRMISPLDTIRSYDHNGRYFSLEKLARFNSMGIWEYSNIHFSKFGTLKNTLAAIINNSSQGMDASQIKAVLGIDTRSFLFQYKDVSGIKEISSKNTEYQQNYATGWVISLETIHKTYMLVK